MWLQFLVSVAEQSWRCVTTRLGDRSTLWRLQQLQRMCSQEATWLENHVKSLKELSAIPLSQSSQSDWFDNRVTSLSWRQFDGNQKVHITWQKTVTLQKHFWSWCNYPKTAFTLPLNHTEYLFKQNKLILLGLFSCTLIWMNTLNVEFPEECHLVWHIIISRYPVFKLSCERWWSDSLQLNN